MKDYKSFYYAPVIEFRDEGICVPITDIDDPDDLPENTVRLWSVYGRDAEGFADCIADCPGAGEAALITGALTMQLATD